MYKPSGNLRRDYERLSGEYMKQKDRILSYQEQIASLRNSNRALEKALAKEKEQHKEESAQKDAEIQALKNKVAHLEALAVGRQIKGDTNGTLKFYVLEI